MTSATKDKSEMGKILPKKYFSKFRKPLAPMPNLVKDQIESFNWLIEKGIKEVFDEFAVINDPTGKKFKFEFLGFEFERPKYDEYFAKEKKISYEGSLKARVKLTNKTLNTEKEQELFITDFPIMTSHGTFIISGNERVIVPQLARSFGVFFTKLEMKGKPLFGVKIIPSRGAWIEIETDIDKTLYVRIDRKRKFSVASLFRAFGAETDSEIMALFKNNPNAKEYIEKSIAKDHAKTADESFVEIYRRLRDGDLATAENAKDFFNSLFSAEKYDLQKVGRFRFNSRFGLPTSGKDSDRRTLNLADLVLVVNHIIELNSTPDAIEDDIDHLGSRRVRYVGELLQQKFRIGMAQIKRNMQNKMSTIDTDMTLPVQFIVPKPLQARIKEFFTTNQLSQFMAQENPLAEVEHLRRLSALGPGGLKRSRAGIEVRDVHTSHYGRLCPIHTPEGPNIGLILQLALYARINEFGMIETPYAKVKDGVVTNKIEYLNALEEEKFAIAHAAIPTDEKGNITVEMVEARLQGKPSLIHKSKIDYMDVATNQAFSIATSMIPFLNHNDANRALMGSNMQKQATPCVEPEAPVVATGIEGLAMRDTGRLVIATSDGIVTKVDGKNIETTHEDKKTIYKLVNFAKTNAATCFHQRPIVNIGDHIKRGDVLADTLTSVNGEMAIGQNILIAFLSWSGSNYEDAIILSEKLVKNNKFTTIHIDEVVVSVRDTKLGPEVTTCDIPNVGESKLKNLAEDGIIRIGAEVNPGDILVGKITPKGESQLTPEERLLRSLFGEKARDVKDTSKRVEGGKKGRIINVQVFSREKGDKLESGIIKRIHIEIAQIRNVSVGDKLSGRHGNKGVISKILPVEDMPYMADGTPIDIILTPLGVPSRMNLGQILEIHLGLAAKNLGYQAIVPAFAGATDKEIKEELKKAGFNEDGKMQLYDGRTGEPFQKPTSVGYMYILKLDHMVEDKIHMRSIGPYSLITQQPLGGKAQGGGQRFGEMEVWALLGHGAAHTLREMLTIKSDDILGRSTAFDAIVKGERIKVENLPAAFNVLVNNLRGLSLNVELLKGKKLEDHQTQKEDGEDNEESN